MICRKVVFRSSARASPNGSSTRCSCSRAKRDQALDHPAAGRRDADQRDAAVAVVAEALDLALGRHAVEHARHGRLLQHRDLRELADRDRLAAGQAGEHAPLRHREAVRSHDRMELGRDQVAGLRQQRSQVVIDEARHAASATWNQAPRGWANGVAARIHSTRRDRLPRLGKT
jgi:hypothetical protein